MPYSLKAEQAVLGSVLIKPSAMEDVTLFLRDADEFYMPAHREIYEAMRHLVTTGKPINPVFLADELRLRGQLSRLEDGEIYLTRLMDVVSTGEDVPHYARQVRDFAVRRRLIKAATEIVLRAHGEEDVHDLVAEHRTAVANLEVPMGAGTVRLGDVLEHGIDEIQSKQDKPDEYEVKTGLHEYDEKIGGWREEQVIVIAARPGKGKSSLAWSTLIRMSMGGVPTLMFSLEMSRQQLIERGLAFVGQVTGNRISRAKIDTKEWIKVHDAGKKLAPLDLHINTDALGLRQICSEARRWAAKIDREARAKALAEKREPPTKVRKVIAVDYLGLVEVEESSDSENRTQVVTKITRRFKKLAKELHCPIALVSQLNRESEKGGKGGVSRKPILADLRDSGSVEQDADLVLFPWRDPGVRGASKGPVPASIIVAKHREGPEGEVDVDWDGRYMAFYDAAERDDDRA